MTADALAQAASELSKALEGAGDAPTTEQVGQAESSLKLVPDKVEKEDKQATTNEEARQKRISDAEWQEMKEKANKVDKLEPLLEKIQQSLSTASPEVKKDVDLDTQVKQLTELNNRKDWEMEHPIVRSDKYRDAWKLMNEDPTFEKLNYDQRWKLIKDEPPSRIKEELAEQRADSGIPPASRNSVQRAAPADVMAADFLRKAGYVKEAHKLYPL